MRSIVLVLRALRVLRASLAVAVSSIAFLSFACGDNAGVRAGSAPDTGITVEIPDAGIDFGQDAGSVVPPSACGPNPDVLLPPDPRRWAGDSERGLLCSPDHWCWENPLPQGNTLNAIWAVAEDDVW